MTNENTEKIINAIKESSYHLANALEQHLVLLKSILEIPTEQPIAQTSQTTTAYQTPTQQYPQPPININQPQTPPMQNSYIPTPQQNIPVQAPAAPIPTAEATYSIDQLSVAAVTLMESGQTQALKDLLAKYQVPAMTSLPKEHYASFAADLRALGVKI